MSGRFRSRFRLRPAACSLLLAVGMLLSHAVSGAEKTELPALYIVHSYEEGDICGQPQQTGALAALESEGYRPGQDFVLHTRHLDTRKENLSPEQIAEAARSTRAEINLLQPRVLLVFDDNAFLHVGLHFVDHPDIHVVYCGVNGQLTDYNKLHRFYESPEKPGHNITGVYEKLHVTDAFRVQREIMPSTQTVLILTDDSRTGRAITRQIDLELEGVSGWEKREAKTWEDYVNLVNEANANDAVGAIYPVALLLSDAAGKSYSTLDILRWTAANSRKPELALNHAFCQFGLFGGAVVDFTAMGGQAGTLAAQILSGRSAGELPLQSAERFTLMFNLQKAKMLDITIPEDILLAAEELYK